MIVFQKIENSSDPLFIKTYELYHSAFPSSERRNFGGFEYILNYNKRFETDVLLLESSFCGLFTHWLFDRFIYVEHFAVDTSMRGKNIGSEAMKDFMKKAKLPIILEVEMPEDSDSIRRIKFYEKLGFKVVPHNYLQPFYDGSGKVLPMLIMSNDYHFADKHFKLIKNTLHGEVYNYFPEE